MNNPITWLSIDIGNTTGIAVWEGDVLIKTAEYKRSPHSAWMQSFGWWLASMVKTEGVQLMTLEAPIVSLKTGEKAGAVKTVGSMLSVEVVELRERDMNRALGLQHKKSPRKTKMMTLAREIDDTITSQDVADAVSIGLAYIKIINEIEEAA
jgi:hypothetical protein